MKINFKQLGIQAETTKQILAVMHNVSKEVQAITKLEKITKADMDQMSVLAEISSDSVDQMNEITKQLNEYYREM